MDDFDKLTVQQLKDKLRSRGLAVSGNKEDLILRLRQDNIEDSASQVSAVSRTSSQLARIAAKQKALEVERSRLAERQQFDQEELRLKQQKQEFQLQTDIAKAAAEAQVLEQFVEHSGERNVFQAANQQPCNERLVKPIVSNDMYFQKNIIDAITIPHVELMKFDGEPIKYWQFIRGFDSTVHNTSLDDGAKLTRLLYYCVGKANAVILPCAVMPTEQGYVKARALLLERFGDNHIILNAWLQRIFSFKAADLKNRFKLLDFSDELKGCVSALDAMGYKAEINSQHILVQIIDKLPMHFKFKWLNKVRTIKALKRLPNIDDLVVFIVNGAIELNDPVYGELCDNKQPKINCDDKQRVPQKFSSHGVSLNLGNNYKSKSNEKFNCILCPEMTHDLFKCERFKANNIFERRKIVKNNRLCFNCLKSGHQANNCLLDRVCSVNNCGKKHTKFLHYENKISEATEGQPDTQTFVNFDLPGSSQSSAFCNKTKQNRVALPILPVIVKNANGQDIIALALLDNGSTDSFCTLSLLNKLGINNTEIPKRNLSFSTLHGHNEINVGVVTLEVRGLEESEVIVLDDVYVKQDLNLIYEPVNEADINAKIQGRLNNRGIYSIDSSMSVELLIGQNSPGALMPLEVCGDGVNGLYATRTKLGWTLNGPFGLSNRKFCQQKVSSFLVSNVHNELESQVAKFWQLDGSCLLNDDTKAMSVDDKKVLELWEKSIEFKEGHYHLPIPFRNNNINLPNNKGTAQQRLLYLKKKLLKDPELHKKYSNEMDNLFNKQFAEQVPYHELHKNDGAVWYIPHHPVKHPKKPEKFRIVFDCAAIYKNTSLNGQVLQGPDLANKLLGTLLRFRTKQYAMMADIESMFYQVHVAEHGRDLLRFLWWPNNDLNEDFCVFRMKVHLFGGSWSPSCCNFALRRTAFDHASEYPPDVINSVLHNFYVDDFLKSVQDEDSGIMIAGKVTSLLKQGGFKLRKWISNSKMIMDSIPKEDRIETEHVNLDYGTPSVERVLGVIWSIKEDAFKMQITVSDKPLTRRGILSMVCSLYDPYGFVAPFTLIAKILIQDLTVRKLGWDEELSDTERSRWTKWKNELSVLENFKTERCIQPIKCGVKKFQLHTFADASEYAYGAVTYLKTTDKNGNTDCALVMAKSRLSPVHRVTIPRLELAAATLAVQLENKIRKEIDLELEESLFWTDSKIVLQYIKSNSRRFLTFVANRVALIHAGSKQEQWQHIESRHNPADDASRGLTATKLVVKKRWLKGPLFLYQDKNLWLQETISDLALNDPELKKPRNMIMSVFVEEGQNPSDRLINYFSSWTKLKRAVSWILVFGSRKPEKLLSVERLEKAEINIIRYVQSLAFEEERKNLLSKKYVKRLSKLRKLDPFLDKNGLLRVGGRIAHSSEEYLAQCPIIIPKKSVVAMLIIRHYHELLGHAGKNHVLSEVRNRFWIINGNSMVRQVLNKCVHCRRFNVRSSQQKMSDLPVDRLQPGPPFTQVGVDYFGPFLIKNGRKQVKRYGVIFTCLSSRAVHIETSATLDTNSFLNALRRFSARRGPVALMRSDNGTNFVGAQRELLKHFDDFSYEKFHCKIAKQGIKWIFNPPKGSHHGGVWERLIRSIRSILSGLMTEFGTQLDDEGFNTLMCEVESILNSRPLTNISDDPKDLKPLTPAMLLTMKEDTEVANEYQSAQVYSRARWRRVQYMSQLFWNRWRKEYLHLLQERSKWQTMKRNYVIGDIILMKEDVPRKLWPMGIIVDVHKDYQQIVRSVTIRSTNGQHYKRPITKVILLVGQEPH